MNTTNVSLSPDTLFGCLPTANLHESILARITPVDAEAVITQILDNNLHNLESTRRQLEAAGRKVVDDVRDAVDTLGTASLAGIEQEISYDDLVRVINTLKAGIARRRVALAS